MAEMGKLGAGDCAQYVLHVAPAGKTESDDGGFDEAAHTLRSTAHGPNQEEALVEDAKLTILRDCIEGLPEEFREMIVMRELEEMSYRQIAEARAWPRAR